MKSRRDFLKTAATGAVLLGSQSKLGLAELLDQHKSRVVVARDAALHTAEGRLDEKRVADLLDRAIAAYTGRDKPAEAWKRIVPVGKVIGLKVNGMGGKPIATHLALTLAVCERLQQAGVKPSEIVVWECRRSDLERAGYTISTDRNRIRCIASDMEGFGYEEKPAAFGSVRVNLAKILTRECDFVINLPVLKDHDLAGVTFSLKNFFGAIQKPAELHGNACNPGIADLNCIPALRNKFRFTIGDAMASIYQGGPGFRPEHLWFPNALIVGHDPVAIDYTGWKIMERKRAEMGLPTVESTGRPTTFLVTAADQDHRLGTNDPQRIHLMEV
ncbi:MAG: DUF362 domain-containing protein [Terracidiphilus sp.]|jgi:uncharacterized protein (DUF362 family)